MEDKIIEIQTKISIKQLLYKLVRENPQTKCEFNNKLVYLFTDEFLDKISNQLNNLYVKGGKKHKKTKRRSREKKTRKIRKQKGGVDSRIVLFFMSFFYVFVNEIVTEKNRLYHFRSMQCVFSFFFFFFFLENNMTKNRNISYIE